MLSQILTSAQATPVPNGLTKDASIYGKIVHFGSVNNLEFERGSLVILGVGEGRNSDCPGASKSPDSIRNYLYALSGHSIPRSIIDLGNISNTNSPADTYAALGMVAELAFEKGLTILVLGGTQELTIPLYRALLKNTSPITLSIVDAKIDLEPNDPDFSLCNFVSSLIDEPRNNLLCINHIGHQTYLSNNNSSAILESKHHELYRLGYLRSAIHEVEPAFRNSQMVSFDLSSIRQSDCPAAHCQSPNGLYAEEACQLGRYAGVSHSTQVFGLYNLNSISDLNGQGAHMAAQVAWHFIDGFYARKGASALGKGSRMKRFYVKSPIPNVNMIFLKNTSTQTWWMEIPFGDNKSSSPSLVACSPSDYKNASKGDVPDRWLRAMKRLM
jgi:formiminoglutamase